MLSKHFRPHIIACISVSFQTWEDYSSSWKLVYIQLHVLFQRIPAYFKTLLSCFAMSKQPNSPGSRKRCHDTQLAGLGSCLSFHLTTYLGQINPAAEEAISHLLNCQLSPLDTLYLIQFLQSPRVTSREYCSCNYHFGSFNTLGNSDQGSHQVSTTTATHMLPEITLA